MGSAQSMGMGHIFCISSGIQKLISNKTQQHTDLWWSSALIWANIRAVKQQHPQPLAAEKFPSNTLILYCTAPYMVCNLCSKSFYSADQQNCLLQHALRLS